MQEVAERFGVRYVLEGSVQRAGDRLRVTAQLIDAVDGRHIWADRFDRTLSDLFTVQDEITKRILEEVDVTLTLGEGARRMHELVPDHECYRLLFLARANFHKNSPEGHAAAERFWSDLYKRIPGSPLGNANMAWIHWQKVMLGLSKDPELDFKLARQFADKMIANHPKPEFINYGMLALLDLWERNHDSAIANGRRGAQLQPGSAEANGLAGVALSASGHLTEGIALFERAMRVGPVYYPWIPMGLTYALMENGDFERAKSYADAILAADVEDVRAHPTALRYLAAMAVWEGDNNSARTFVERASALTPTASLARIKQGNSFRKNQAFADRFLDALRHAGMPE